MESAAPAGSTAGSSAGFSVIVATWDSALLGGVTPRAVAWGEGQVQHQRAHEFPGHRL